MTPKTCPPGFNQQNGELRSYLQELVEMSNSALQAIVLPLEALLGAAVLTASEEYRIPAEFNLAIFQIHTDWRSTALATEPALNAAITSLDLPGLAQARLSNIKATLQLKDRKLDVFENGDVAMSALFKNPAFFLPNAPLLIPAGSTLKADFAVQDSTAAVIGNNAYYGIILTGALIPITR